MFFISGTVTPNGNVRSNLPAINPRMAVEGFGMMVHSMPSRYGRAGFQYCVLRIRLIDSFGLYETNLNGPVPMGCCRISLAERRDRVNGRIPGSKQRDKSGLRPPEVECDVVPPDADRFQIAIPGLAWIGA